MLQRFMHHDLHENVEFVEAVPKDSALVNYYGDGTWDRGSDLNQQRGEIACFLSHLKAIRKILEDADSDTTGGIICEDDALLRNDFQARTQALWLNKPDDTPLICLGYYVEHWIGFKWSGKDPNMKNMCQIVSDHVWATTMYWISIEYAKEILRKYDRQFKHFEGYRTAELITRFSNGYIAYPPPCIEDCIGSDIRASSGMDLHIRVHGKWGYSNYSDAEYSHESPLYKVECDQHGRKFNPTREGEPISDVQIWVRDRQRDIFNAGEMLSRLPGAMGKFGALRMNDSKRGDGPLGPEGLVSNQLTVLEREIPIISGAHTYYSSHHGAGAVPHTSYRSVDDIENEQLQQALEESLRSAQGIGDKPTGALRSLMSADGSEETFDNPTVLEVIPIDGSEVINSKETSSPEKGDGKQEYVSDNDESDGEKDRGNKTGGEDRGNKDGGNDDDWDFIDI